MWDLPDTPDLLIAMGTLFTGAAAMWAAYSAHCGLTTWKNNQEYELVKQLAAAVYHHKKSLLAITFPDNSVEEKALMNAPQSNEGPNYKIFWNRFAKTKPFLADVEALLAQAELRWGKKIVDAYKPVRSVEKKILAKIMRTEEPPSFNEDDYKQLLEAKDYLSDLHYRHECDAAKEIIEAFEQIEKFLRDKL